VTVRLAALSCSAAGTSASRTASHVTIRAAARRIRRVRSVGTWATQEESNP
jgi:hypothetical protein